MKFIKKHIIRWRNSQSSKLLLIRNYPNSINKVGIITNSDFMPDTNFITKLKNGFGGQTQIFIFVIGERLKNNKNFYKIGFDDLNYFGQLKNRSISDTLGDLDALIDMTLYRTGLHRYVFEHCSKAYKISLGKGCLDNFNLVFDLNPLDKNLFVDEIIKYHNLIKNE